MKRVLFARAEFNIYVSCVLVLYEIQLRIFLGVEWSFDIDFNVRVGLVLKKYI